MSSILRLDHLSDCFLPGRHAYRPIYSRVQFLGESFSDLGRTVALSGVSNTISSVLFFIALITTGILFFPFLVAFPGLFTRARIVRYIGIIGSAIGFYSSICFVGIAFTPGDLALEGHKFFVQNAFVTLLPVAVCYTIAMLLEKYPKRYPAVFVVFTAILIAYVWLMFYGPASTSLEGLIIHVVGQKVVVYSMITCFAIQAYGALQVSRQKILVTA